MEMPEKYKNAPEWKQQLLVVFYQHGGKLSTEDYTEFASKHNISLGTVRSAYYKLIEQVQNEVIPLPSAQQPEPPPQVDDWRVALQQRLEQEGKPKNASAMFREMAQQYPISKKTLEREYYMLLYKLEPGQKKTAGAKAPNSEWRQLIKDDIEKGVKPDNLQAYFREIAEAYNLSVNTVNSNYYSLVRQKSRDTTLDPEWRKELREMVAQRGKLEQADFDMLADKHGVSMPSVRGVYGNMVRYMKNNPQPEGGQPEEKPHQESPSSTTLESEVPDEPEVEEPKPVENKIVQALQHYNVQVRAAAHMEQLEDFMADVEEDLIIHAILLSEGKNTAYALTILNDWVFTKGYTKLAHHPTFKQTEGKPMMGAIEQAYDDVRATSYRIDKGQLADVQYTPVVPMAKTFYNKGTIIEVRVTNVEAYGAFIETTDGHATPGLIHKSNARPIYVADLNKWFKIGQILRAQILEYKASENKLSLSTRNLPMTAHGIATKKDTSPKQTTLPNIVIGETAATQETTPVAPPTTKGDSTYMETEWKQAKPFIESVVGQVSAPAEQALKMLMEQQGVFNFTVNLMKIKENFQPDIGLLLAQQLRDAASVKAAEKDGRL